jgi:hypothetical protein
MLVYPSLANVVAEVLFHTFVASEVSEFITVRALLLVAIVMLVIEIAIAAM